MKNSRNILIPSFVFLIASVAILLWHGAKTGTMTQSASAGKSAAGTQSSNRRIYDSGPDTRRVPGQPASTGRQSGSAQPPPPARVPFDALIAGRVPLRTETRKFEAQKWEVDLAKSLDLPPGTSLQRRSALYRIPELKSSLVRVDRVYRMDLNVAARSASPSSGPRGSAPISIAGQSAAASESMPSASTTTVRSSSSNSGAVGFSPGNHVDPSTPKVPSSPTSGSHSAPTGDTSTNGASIAHPNGSHPTQNTETLVGSAVLDAGGGELLWDNAMIADRLMVQLEDGISRERFQASLPAGVNVRESITSRGLYLVAVPAEGDRSLERAVLAMSKLKGVVRYAEPDFLICGADTSPNDPLFTADPMDITKQWHLPKIMAPRTWDVIKQPKTTTIANQTVVAVVDTGVDYTHPDLAANIWSNPGETGTDGNGNNRATNGIDDDANGKVDDSRGWSFVEQNNNPMDDVGHGTHVAGIIGALGNNATGVTGVCWGVKMLPLRIIKKLGLGTYGLYSDAIGAMEYIRTLNNVSRKVAVANHSWGGSGYSLAMLNAVNFPLPSSDPLPAGITGTFADDVNQFVVSGSPAEIAKIKVGMKVTGAGIPITDSTRGDTLVTIIEGTTLTLSNFTFAAGSNVALGFSNPVRPKSYGVVHVAAAGNSRFNTDRIPTYPASLPSGFMVCVGASDTTDSVALWAGGAGSNFGRLTVDLFAPGSNIWSTKWKAPGDPAYGYESRNGTSMAAPQVAAAAALIRMWQPALTDIQTRQLIIENTLPVPALNLKCMSGGRLDISRVVDRLYQPVLSGSGGGTQGGGMSSEALAGGTAITGAVASGSNHTLVARNGKVYGWGGNGAYQLGVNAPAESGVPIEVPGLTDIIMVATNGLSSYALGSDGRVWTWGRTASGASSATPVAMSSLSEMVWISGSGNHMLAVKADGTVWAWTYSSNGNQYGQLGDGTVIYKSTPVQVSGLTDVVMAEAGMTHSIALKSNGTVFCWGRRTSGAGNNPLGDGSALTSPSLTPVEVPGLTDVAHIDATLGTSGYTANGGSLVVRKDGSVWGWGNIPSIVSNVPVQRPGLANMILAQLNGASVLTMDSDGRVAVWGGGANGNLGNGSFASVNGVSQVLMPGDQAIIGLGASETNVYALSVEGALYAAGTNSSGKLGIGTLGSKAYPVRIPNLRNISNVAYGFTVGWGGYAADSGGNIFNWGSNYGGTGNSSNLNMTPVSVTFMTGAKRIEGARGAGACLFTKADNLLWSWGGFGAPLGNSNLSGDSQAQLVPVASTVVDFQESTFNDYGDGTGASVYSSGFAAAVLSDGRVQTWGRNEYGQLGRGAGNGSLTPVFVSNITNATRVALGRRHALALLTDGTLVVWGRNDRGQFGDGTIIDSAIPKAVPGLSGIVAIAAINDSSFAVTNTGVVYSWGRNVQAGLGFNGTADVLQPGPVGGLPPIVSISASAFNVLLLAADATVWAWGQSLSMLGRGLDSPIAARLPGQVVGLSNVIQVVSGNPAYARKSDGTVWGWGGSVSATLGYGDAITNIPVAVVGFTGTTQTLSTLGTGSSTDSWQFQNFSVPELLNDSLVGDMADPDGDGIGNLIEYSLGMNPRSNSLIGLPAARSDLINTSSKSESAGQMQIFSQPTVDLADGKRFMVFTVSRQGIRPDVEYLVEVSTDLVTWRSGDPHTVTVLDTAETLEVYSATSLDDAPRQFMRLKIQRK
jgi:alpha-tubulin suppressor-like RCC1 family protein